MPKPDEYFLPFAEVAFNAYQAEQRKQDPSWPTLPWNRQGAVAQARWVEAVKAVFAALNMRDEGGEPFVSPTDL